MAKDKSTKAKHQQAAVDEEINRRFDQLINPSLEEFKGELQYDAKGWLAEMESDENLKGPLDLMTALAIICARHITAILISSRNLKSFCVSGRALFTERWMLCSGLYVLSAVNQKLRSLPEDEWNRWPEKGGSCFEVRELSTLLTLDAFCTKVEITSFEWIFRWIWSVTGRPVDCDPVLSVIGNAVKDSCTLNFIQWAQTSNLRIDESTQPQIFAKK